MNNTFTSSGVYFLEKATVCFLACGLHFSFFSNTNIFPLIRPPWRCPDKGKGCQDEMLICLHILPVLLYMYYCQWKTRGCRKALAKEQSKTEVAAKGEPEIRWNRCLMSKLILTVMCCPSVLIRRLLGIFCGLVLHM